MELYNFTYYLIILLAMILLSYYAFKLDSKIVMLVVAICGLTAVKYPDLVEISAEEYYRLSLLKENYGNNAEVDNAFKDALEDDKIVLREGAEILEIISSLYKEELKDYYSKTIQEIETKKERLNKEKALQDVKDELKREKDLQELEEVKQTIKG